MSDEGGVAFVAYASGNQTVADCILEGVRHANAIPGPVRFEPWVFNDVPGNPLLSPIVDKIEESPFVVADITLLNLNVVYEIGYAVGRSRRVFLIRHSGVEGDKALARSVGIFDTLGYHEYRDFQSLRDRLTSHIDPTPLPVSVNLDRKAPIYVVEPETRTSAATVMVSRLKKAGYRYRSFSPGEDVRLSANDAIRQVSASSGVLLLLQAPDVPGSQPQNIRSMFVAGIAHGLGKPTLILGAAGYDPPLDVRDVVARYRDPQDIANHIAEFCPQINDYSQQAEPPAIETGGLLQSLSIGDSTAENEMTTLWRYYLRTNQYQKTLRGEVNLVVGRKGSWKTALFIQVRDRIRSNRQNIVVDLKPEGYQLIKIKEDILSYLADGARQHLITAFWEYLILLEVAHKLLEKDKSTHRFNHDLYEPYLELEGAYRVGNFASEGDFSERLASLSLRIADEYKHSYGSAAGKRLTAQEVTELLYTHDIRKLRDRITAYLERKQSVWILFDNLDKGWSTQGVDVIDSIVLRCLIDAGRRVEREMQRAGRPFHCIVFVRNDVYEHLMSNSADYGKEMRAVLDWTDPDLLREMLRLRLVSKLDDASAVEFDQIWPNICASHFHGEETSAYIIERSLMRPRNVLKIFNHARGFASNFNRAKIAEEDLEKGLRAYSQDVLVELDRELTDVFPAAKDLLYYFIDAPSVLPEAKVRLLLKEAGITPDDFEKVVDFLLYYGVLGIKTDEADQFIYTVHYDLKPLKIRTTRAAGAACYVVNPAFWPALGITVTPNVDRTVQLKL